MHDSVEVVVERARARIGTTLREKWRLERLLGVGGMAAVYAATHRNGKRVAVKILHAELSVHADVRSRFLREGYVANKVEHAGAVVVLDDDVAEDGSVFLVMELLEGETLAERIERRGGQIGTEEALVIADQMLDVLAKAHEKGIVHRDIKPDNVFVRRTGDIALLDFGIARLRELSDATATRTGAVMGTPAYMAPEQARAHWDEVDARTDLWAVGATLFRALTGRSVHEADTLNEQLLAAMTRPADSLAAVHPGASIPMIEIVDRALAFDKRDRWEHARAMQTAVRRAYAALVGTSCEGVRLAAAGESASGTPERRSSGSKEAGLEAARSPPPAGPSRASRRGSTWFFVCVAGAVLIGMAYWELRSSAPTGTAASALFATALPSGSGLPEPREGVPPSLGPSLQDASLVEAAAAALAAHDVRTADRPMTDEVAASAVRSAGPASPAATSAKPTGAKPQTRKEKKSVPPHKPHRR